jgi:hypothetical protein
MDLTVYLPDNIGERAKTAEPKINLSALLRAAVVAELDRRKRVSKLLKGAHEHELDLQGPEGEPYIGVLTGTQITEGQGGVTVYLATDGRVLAYDENSGTVTEVESADSWRDGDFDTYLAVCDALGVTPRVAV